MVEHDLAKVGVAGSSPVSRSKERIRDEKSIPMNIGKSRFPLNMKERRSFSEKNGILVSRSFIFIEGCPGGGIGRHVGLKIQWPIYGRGGSSPPPGTCCENSSVGRARPCQGRGRGFESRFSLEGENKGREVYPDENREVPPVPTVSSGVFAPNLRLHPAAIFSMSYYVSILYSASTYSYLKNYIILFIFNGSVFQELNFLPKGLVGKPQ